MPNYKSDNINEIFNKTNLWQTYIKVESEMSQAQAEVGIIPQWAADNISKNASIDLIGIKKIEKTFNKTKSLILSIVKEFSNVCGEAGEYIHWGGTTRNIIDTGYTILIREAHHHILEQLSFALLKLSEMSLKHSSTPMVARTFGQNALPISFGFKIAGWIENLSRVDQRFKQVERRVFSLHFGGAVGAMHGFGDKGYEFTEVLSKRLGLVNTLVHNRVSKDKFIEYLISLTLLGMSIGQISREINLLMSQSISELSEIISKNQISSSTMPHKLNPILISDVLSLSNLLRAKISGLIELGMPQHEGDSSVDKSLEVIIEETTILSFNLLLTFNNLLNNINVNSRKMKENLFQSKDYIASENLMLNLAKKMGRQKSHDLIQKIIKKTFSEKKSVRESLSNNQTILKYLSKEEILIHLDPLNYLGQSISIAKKASSLGKETSEQIQKRISSPFLEVL